MQNFWDFKVWGFVCLLSFLLLSLLLANLVKKNVPFLKASLIPTSVIGGFFLLIVAVVYQAIMGEDFFNAPIFCENGRNALEALTYHCLALGFIATVFRPGKPRFSKKRNIEIFNTGCTTVATYCLQAGLGLGVTILANRISGGKIFKAAGVLLCFGFGQGTGQALNYGSIYEEIGFTGGRSFGLSIAAIGFLVAALGGVLHLTYLRRKFGLKSPEENAERFESSDIQSADEIPMNGSIDKMSIQIGIVFGTYLLTYLIMWGISALVPSLRSIMYGLNFLVGVLCANLILFILNRMKKWGIVKKEYVNAFLMKRISGFFFDMMIVAGIAAISIDFLKDYWLVVLVLGVVGTLATFFYNKLIAKVLFKEYSEEQFLAMYGMLTGTASTGIILLRELDPEFRSPVTDNLIYQNFPAIVFGFPLMIVANNAPGNELLYCIVGFAAFGVMNLILFRRGILYIFKRKQHRKKNKENNT